MTPTVSIIIPSYNREKLITKAIDSVVAQTYQNTEIVVVDDGSTDRTRDVVMAYGRDIVYVFQKNKGIAGARNTGMRRCTGDYIAFLDSDDYWKPAKLARQLQLFRDHPEYGMVASQCASVQSDGSFREKNRPGISGWVLQNLFNKNFIRTSAAVITRTCMNRVGLFDETLREGEEYDYWLRIAAQFPIGFINESLAVYVDNPHGVSTDSLAGRLHRLTILEKGYLKEKIPAHLYKRRIADTCHYIGRHYIAKGDPSEGLRYLRKARGLAPLFIKNMLYLTWHSMKL